MNKSNISLPFPRVLTAGMALSLLIASLPLWAGADEGEPVEERRVKVMVSGDGDAEVVRLDASDMEEGDSRQILTDGGKEVVITRTGDGFSIAVDGEELDLPNMADHGDQDVNVTMVRDFVHAHASDGDAKSVMVFTSVDDETLGANGKTMIRKVMLNASGAEGHDGNQAVLISEDGAKVEVGSEGLSRWVSDGESSNVKIIKWGDCENDGSEACGRADVDLRHLGHDGNIQDHLLESGALDDLTSEQRQKVMDALQSYDGASRFVVIETDEDAAI